MGGYDLHVHTRYSYDSVQSPRRVLDVARRRGLDGVAITDHDEFEGAREAARLADDLLVVKGMEVKTDDYDDLLALFVDEPVQSRSFTDAVAEIHDQGGLAVLPHPYRKFDSVPDWVLDAVDAVERLNARSKSKWNDAAARLAADRGLPTTAGSDAHTSFELGKARVHLSNGDSDAIPDGDSDAVPDGDSGANENADVNANAGADADADAEDSERERLKRAIAAGETTISGEESPYYPTHGASVAIELLKSRVGSL